MNDSGRTWKWSDVWAAMERVIAACARLSAKCEELAKVGAPVELTTAESQ